MNTIEKWGSGEVWYKCSISFIDKYYWEVRVRVTYTTVQLVLLVNTIEKWESCEDWYNCSISFADEYNWEVRVSVTDTTVQLVLLMNTIEKWESVWGALDISQACTLYCVFVCLLGNSYSNFDDCQSTGNICCKFYPTWGNTYEDEITILYQELPGPVSGERRACIRGKARDKLTCSPSSVNFDIQSIWILFNFCGMLQQYIVTK